MVHCRSWLGIFALWILCLPQWASAEVVRQGNLTFDLPGIPGFCTLDREHAVDRLFFEQQERIQAQNNLVLSIIVPCPELDAMHQGATQLSSWAIWLLNAPSGVPARIPSGIARQQLFDQLAKTMPKVDLASLNSRLQERFDKEGVEANVNRFGVIERDQNALYLGMLGEYAAPGIKAEVAGVIGMTALGSSIVSVNLYREHSGQPIFDDQLRIVRDVMKILIAQNAG